MKRRKHLFRSGCKAPNLLMTLAIFCILFPASARSDVASTNYSISGEFSFGTGNESSANYQVADSALDVFLQVPLSSANYQLGSRAEAFSATGLAGINSIAPSNFPKFYSDSTANYTVNATDPDNDSLQYRAKQDGTLKDGPQAGNELSWALSDNDLGRRNVELAVMDADGTVVKNQSAYIVKRPVK